MGKRTTSRRSGTKDHRCTVRQFGFGLLLTVALLTMITTFIQSARVLQNRPQHHDPPLSRVVPADVAGPPPSVGASPTVAESPTSTRSADPPRTSHPVVPPFHRNASGIAVPTVHYRFLVAVISSPDHASERTAVRETWAKLAKTVPSLVRFVVGEPADASAATRKALVVEQATHGDLLRVPMVESYRKLVDKTELLFQAATRGADTLLASGDTVTFDYLVKVDDDTFLRLDTLDSILPDDPRFVYWGSMNRHVRVQRDPDHRWYDGVYQGGDRYPVYAQGACYALSRQLLLKLVERPLAHTFIPPKPEAVGAPPTRLRLPMEDVSVGLWIFDVFGESFGLQRLHAGEGLWPEKSIRTGVPTDFCAESMVVRRHAHDSSVLYGLWANLDKCGKLCKCP